MPLCAVAATVYMASCESDSFMEDFGDLDINSCVPLTRSSPQDIIQGTDNSYKQVPVYENECMLNAILQIAVTYRIPVYGTYVSRTYPAVDAYQALRDSATKYSQNNPEYIDAPYQGGAMKPSLGAEVGEKSGILEGKVQHFGNYSELYNFLNRPEWESSHPDGQYLINYTHEGDSHTGRCKGVSGDNINVISAQYGSEKMKPTEIYTDMSIIY